MDKSDVRKLLYCIQNSLFRGYAEGYKDKIGSRTDKMRRLLPKSQLISAY